MGELNFTCEDRNHAVKENSSVHGLSKLTVKAIYPKQV